MIFGCSKLQNHPTNDLWGVQEVQEYSQNENIPLIVCSMVHIQALR